MSGKSEALQALGTLELKLDGVVFAMDKVAEAAGEAELALADLSNLIDDIEEAKE